jgi:hypothetical protein
MDPEIITSAKLLGITREHSDHRGGADMHSTGRLIFRKGRTDRADPLSWWVEFECESCGDRIYQHHADDRAVIRSVLREAGIAGT